MSLLVRNALQDGCNAIRVGDFTAGQEIGFCIARLQAGETHETRLSKAETAIVLLGGTCTVKCGDVTYERVGERPNVFAGRATAVYVPPGLPVEVIAATDAEIAVAATPATKEGEPQLVTPDEVCVRSVGRWNWRREVQDIIGENVPAERLLVGETYNPPGNWSSYPPHKHDEDNLPHEVKMEEVYHFRINPPNGFGIQRIYSAKHSADAELDETYTVRDGDTVAIPRGYHPVGAAPGYQLYYLWILSGANRIMRPNDDPEHAWVKAVEAVAAEMAR
ncbi:MAG: 5-deoxy-glucuronate isomerase, partial [Armatimonadota bacterium]